MKNKIEKINWIVIKGIHEDLHKTLIELDIGVLLEPNGWKESIGEIARSW